jgi:dipeptidyl aminopeptidase/acylaminoacyl peptidase
LVPLCQSELFFHALQKAKVPSQLVIVPGGQHGPGLFEEKYYKMMTDFFLQVANKTLK